MYFLLVVVCLLNMRTFRWWMFILFWGTDVNWGQGSRLYICQCWLQEVGYLCSRSSPSRYRWYVDRYSRCRLQVRPVRETPEHRRRAGNHQDTVSRLVPEQDTWSCEVQSTDFIEHTRCSLARTHVRPAHLLHGRSFTTSQHRVVRVVNSNAFNV